MSVADYLIAAGLSKDHVSAAGYGPNRPAVEGASKEALQQNRRVEIAIFASEEMQSEMLREHGR